MAKAYKQRQANKRLSVARGAQHWCRISVLATGPMLTEWYSLKVLTSAVASCARFVRDGTALHSLAL